MSQVAFSRYNVTSELRKCRERCLISERSHNKRLMRLVTVELVSVLAYSLILSTLPCTHMK